MKRTIQILLLLTSSLLLSCGVQRQTVAGRSDGSYQEHRADSVSTADTATLSIEVNLQESGSTVSTETTDESVITEIFEYDTTQPADSLTGLPPLKRYTRQERQTSTARRDSSATGRQMDAAVQLDKMSQSDSVSVATATGTWTEETTVKIKKGMSWPIKALCIIGAFAIVAALVYLFIKIKF